MTAHSPGPWTANLDYKTAQPIGRYLARADILAGKQRIGAATIG